MSGGVEQARRALARVGASSRIAAKDALRGGLTESVPVTAAMVLAVLGTGIALGSAMSPPQPRIAVRQIAAADPAQGATAPVTPAPPAGLPAISPRTTAPPAPDSEPAADTTGAPAGDTPDSDSGENQDDDDAQSPPATDTPAPPVAKLPAIKHVLVIRLGDAPVAHPFAPDPAAPYLGTTLIPKGTLLPHLRTVAGTGLADAIALLSGQAPKPQTLAGCPVYNDVTPATIGKDGQEQGDGCVLSVQTPALTTQLKRKSLTWRAYVEDQGNGGPGVATSCRHPAAGAADPWREPRPGDAYVTVRNPFMYFHAVTDLKDCGTNVIDFTQLDADLARPAAKVPAFSYIVPNACHDGRATPCMPGAPAGLPAADAFLAALLPKVFASKAYADALVILSFDRAFAAPGFTASPDGGKVGALLLSPFVREGRELGGRYDTYSLLAVIEDIFALERLGKATEPAKSIGAGTFDAK